ncbi:MAG: hypothetical protein RSC98_08800, partial [Clostridia bacterium]
MKIDLTCPVELWQYAMPTEDDVECTFVLNNLNDKAVTSVQVTLACYDQEDMLLFRQTERMQGLKAAPGERFSVMLLPAQWRDVEGVDLVIEKVWFEDATIWRRGNAPLTSYISNRLPIGRALDQLRFVAGKDAVGYPEVQDQVWLCVCGRANSLESDRCCRCERRRDSVFASFSCFNVEQVIAVHEQKLADQARQAREENSRLAETQEKQKLAKRRRRVKIIRFALSSLCLAAVIVVVVVWGVPTLRYNSALRKRDGGEFDNARAAFSAMGNYRDAQTQLVECDYREANALLNAGDTEALLQAARAFAALGDYADSHSLWQQATYELGQAYLASASFEAAASAFQSLGDYEDSADQLREATYQQAEHLLQNESFTVAKLLFASLGDYHDAAMKARACVYEQGKAYFAEKKYEQAIELLGQTNGYENAGELFKQASYQLAEEKLVAGDPQAAGEL